MRNRNSRNRNRRNVFLVLVVALVVVTMIAGSCSTRPEGVQTDPAVHVQKFPRQEFDDKIDRNA